MVPLLFGVAGMIKGLHTSGSTSSVLAGDDGSLSLSGNIEEKRDLGSVKFSIPGAPRTDRSAHINIPLYDNPLGIFSIENNPRIEFAFTDKKILENRGFRYYGWEYDINIYGLARNINVELNNIEGYQIKSVEASWCWHEEN